MPYISARVSEKVPADKAERIKTLLGEAIEAIPGKSENWLMVEICPECALWFRGDNSESTAYVEVKIFGRAASSACEKLTALICGIFEAELGISPERTYVKYEFCDTWGWNNSNF